MSGGCRLLFIIFFFHRKFGVHPKGPGRDDAPFQPQTGCIDPEAGQGGFFQSIPAAWPPGTSGSPSWLLFASKYRPEISAEKPRGNGPNNEGFEDAFSAQHSALRCWEVKGRGKQVGERRKGRMRSLMSWFGGCEGQAGHFGAAL